jgi:glyoxylase-like metal-dependent hydrolase (beta-lactamase superfamily II)
MSSSAGVLPRLRVHAGLMLGVVALLATQPLPAQQASPPPPLVKPDALKGISQHVQVIPDDSVPLVPNVGYIVGDKAVLVIDTGLGPRNGEAVFAVAQKLAGSRPIYLAVTHVHPEHDLGAQAFSADTRLIRSADQQKDIAEFGLELAKVFAGRSAVNAELLKGAEFRKPDIVFDQEYDLDLGGVSARLLAMGPNHTRGDVGIWIERDQVLFAGDLAMKAQPAFASPYSSIRQWFASLDRLAALNPVVIVPSHGPLGDNGFITGYRNYLKEVLERTTAEKKAGHTADATVQDVTAAMVDRYPDRGRLAGAIKAAYAAAP